MKPSNVENHSFEPGWTESELKVIDNNIANLFTAMLKKETNVIIQIKKIKESYGNDNVPKLQQLVHENPDILNYLNADILWDIVKKGYVHTWQYLLSLPGIAQKMQEIYDSTAVNLLATALCSEQYDMFNLLVEMNREVKGLRLKLMSDSNISVGMANANAFSSVKYHRLNSEIVYVVGLNNPGLLTRFIFANPECFTDKQMHEHLRFELLNNFTEGFNLFNKMKLHDVLMQKLPQQEDKGNNSTKL
jgi:hypothetical protein